MKKQSSQIVRSSCSRSSPAGNHQAHEAVVWAPRDWNDMTQDEKTDFLEKEAAAWVMRGEVIEYTASEYDPDADTGWSNTSYEDEDTEEWF